MPSSLKDFAADPTSYGAPARIPSKGKRLPRANYIGLAIVDKNLLPDIGSSTTFTPPGGSAAAITTSNLVSVLQTLALNGMAYVFGNGLIMGKRTPFKSDEEAVIFGSQRTKHDTGEGEYTFSMNFKYAYMNTSFMNQLRLQFVDQDFYFFTDRSVEVVRFDSQEPVVKNVRNGEVTGNNGDVISNGGFDLIVGSDGEIEPEFGLFEKALNFANFKYTFGAPTTTGTGMSTALGGTIINKTSVGSGTIVNAITQTVQAGVVSYSAFKDDGSALPANVTIDSTTGTLTVAAGVTAGSYKIVVMAENKVGVTGEYRFTLVAG